MRAAGDRQSTRSPRRWSAVAPVALALTLLGAGVAQAQERVIAGPSPSTYLTDSVSIDRGDTLRFLNLDLTAPHDVASFDRAGDGSFLFKSAIIGAPSEVPVEGAERLGGGSYGYFCTIHPWMRGTLTVRGEAGQDPGGDPDVGVRILDKRIRPVLRSDRLRARVTVDRAARVRINATVGKRTIARGRGALEEAGGARVGARVTKAGKRQLRQASRRGNRVRVTVVARAVDEDGNASTARARQALR